MVRHFPKQVIAVSVFRDQVPDTLPPAARLVVATLVIFVPLPTKQLTLVIVWLPLLVSITPFEVTERTLTHVVAHLIWSVVAFSTLLVVVVVRPVSHRLSIPPTATVKAIRRTVAIIGLIALELENFINYTLQHVCPDLHSPVTPIVRHLPVQVNTVPKPDS
jgi:hypothetical protein